MNLVQVDQPRMPDDNWFTDWAWEIIAGGDKELEALLKAYGED